jgi:hypothetical protein
MAYPVRWLTDTTILYRVTTGSEVADYAVTTAGGQTRKVTDVVSTYNAAN